MAQTRQQFSVISAKLLQERSRCMSCKHTQMGA